MNLENNKITQDYISYDVIVELFFKDYYNRLIDKFDTIDDEYFNDLEILEIFLKRSNSVKNIHKTANDLLNRFSTLAGVINAPPKLLQEITGSEPFFIIDLKLLKICAKRLTKTEVLHKNILTSWSNVIEYATVAMAYEQTEQFRILFLDKRNRLIADEIQQKGTIDHTPVYPREVVKRALELSSTALILLHNHPSGNTTPSKADIDITKTIISVAEPLGITVHDHIIIGKSEHTSMRGLQLI